MLANVRAYHHSHPFVKRDTGEPRIEDLCSYYDDANHIQVNVRLVMKDTCTDEEWKFIKKAYNDLYKCIEDGFQTNLECFVVYEPGYVHFPGTKNRLIGSVRDDKVSVLNDVGTVALPIVFRV
ncbi:hypothetical protein DPMN_155472 [Dreissena polymorpha]|uniref:Uncharacterized protein n=1 Tax=Dreissena polymorpha TaxID=45954 RepID=A0A9D4FSN0_DREPO|nr:hypothetical protein DPMN_155472 [Dreissena polymorpha]